MYSHRIRLIANRNRRRACALSVLSPRCRLSVTALQRQPKEIVGIKAPAGIPIVFAILWPRRYVVVPVLASDSIPRRTFVRRCVCSAT